MYFPLKKNEFPLMENDFPLKRIHFSLKKNDFPLMENMSIILNTILCPFGFPTYELISL